MLLSRSMELYRRACGSAVEFKVDLASSLPLVMVDAAQFEAAILNLVANSRDAMTNRGAITLSTHLLHRAPPHDPGAATGDYVCISVRDDGSGMSEELVDRASEPFFTTKQVGKGSGLGLSQVFGFAAQSGGFALIESEENVGTSVSLCLPPQDLQ